METEVTAGLFHLWKWMKLPGFSSLETDETAGLPFGTQTGQRFGELTAAQFV